MKFFAKKCYCGAHRILKNDGVLIAKQETENGQIKFKMLRFICAKVRLNLQSHFSGTKCLLRIPCPPQAKFLEEKYSVPQILRYGILKYSVDIPYSVPVLSVLHPPCGT